MTPLELVLDRLSGNGNKPRQCGGGYTALCPAHEDKSPSLTVSEGEDGRVLLKCHAGCRTEDVVAALGLAMKDLFVPSGRPQLLREVTYEIRDSEGTLVAEHVRKEFADASKTFSWRRNGVWNLGGLPVKDLPLYGVHELPSPDGEPVVVAEGEKARDALARAGVRTVATVTGASGTPSADVLKALLGFDVVTWPDNDPEGRDHMRRVGGVLLRLGCVPRILEWSGAPAKGDAADFLARGGTKEGIQALIAAAKPKSVNSVNSVDGVVWKTPIPFQLDLPDLPPFPVQTLPPVLRRLSGALSRQAQVPVEMVAACALGATSLSISGRFVVEPWEGWREQTNLWFAPTAASGSRKSTVIEKSIKPIYRVELELQAEAAPKIAKLFSRKRIAKKALDEAERKAAKDPENTSLRAEAERLAVEHDKISVLARPRLVTTNATSEALVKLLAENDGRILVESAEGGEMIAIAAGLYTKGRDNYDVLLKGWSGDPISVDRKTTEPVYVPQPAIAMALMFQPAVLHEMAAHKTFRGRGLLGRFLYVFCTSLVGYRKARGEPMPDGVEQEYQDLIGNLLRLATGRLQLEGDEDEPTGPIIPKVIRFSVEAAGILEHFFNEMEKDQREGGPLEGMRDWASKAHGQVARIAAVLHMALHHDQPEPWEIQVSAQTARNAVTLGRYFLAHAKAAFALMGQNPDVARALRILRHLEEKGIRETTKRDLHRALMSVFETADLLDRPLEILEERGYLHLVEPTREPGRRGRSASLQILVNPEYPPDRNDTNDRNTPPSPTPGNSVNSVNSVSEPVSEDAVDGEPEEPPESEGRVRF